MATSPSFLPISDSPSTGDAPVPFAGHSRYFHSGDGRWIKYNLLQVIESPHRASIAFFGPSSRGILSCRFAYLCHAQVAGQSPLQHFDTNRVTQPFALPVLFCPASPFQDAASFCRLDRLCHTPVDRYHHFCKEPSSLIAQQYRRMTAHHAGATAMSAHPAAICARAKFLARASRTADTSRCVA